MGAPRNPPAALISATASFAPFWSLGPYGDNPPVRERRVPIRRDGFAGALENTPAKPAASVSTFVKTRTAITIHKTLVLGADFAISPEGAFSSSMITPLGDILTQS